MSRVRSASSNRPSSLGELLSASQDLTRSERVSWWLWRQAVGKRIAARSIPDRFDDNTLLVKVKSALWAQELSLHAPLILERLRIQHPRIRALRFQVSEVVLPELPAARHVPRPVQLPQALED